MKTLLLILILLIPTVLKSQEQATTDNTNQYLEKSIRQKKTANAITITGGGLFLTGVVVAMTAPQPDFLFSSQALAGIGICTVGVVTALVSVPFYISAHSNKKKSIRISPQSGRVMIDQNTYVTTGISFIF